MTKYLVVYCYEQTKMDGTATRIVKEGLYDTYEVAEMVDEAIWERFETAPPEKRPEYLLTSEIIPIEI